MTSESTEVVRRMYEAFHRGDAETALAHFDPEVVIDASARIDGGVGHGRDGVAEMIGGWIATFDDWSEEIEELREVGDHVYVASRQRGLGKGSGIETEFRYGVLYEVRGGLIARMVMFNDPAEALEAAGARRP